MLHDNEQVERLCQDTNQWQFGDFYRVLLLDHFRRLGSPAVRQTWNYRKMSEVSNDGILVEIRAKIAFAYTV